MPRPLNVDRERALCTPRSLLIDPTAFGIDPVAGWRYGGDVPPAIAVAVIRAYWQHNASCVVREHFGRRSLVGVASALHEALTACGLVDETVRGPEHLNRLLSGALAAPMQQLISWTLATGDVSVLPSSQTLSALFPPGTAGRVAG